MAAVAAAEVLGSVCSSLGRRSDSELALPVSTGLSACASGPVVSGGEILRLYLIPIRRYRVEAVGTFCAMLSGSAGAVRLIALRTTSGITITLPLAGGGGGDVGRGGGGVGAVWASHGRHKLAFSATAGSIFS